MVDTPLWQVQPAKQLPASRMKLESSQNLSPDSELESMILVGCGRLDDNLLNHLIHLTFVWKFLVAIYEDKMTIGEL